MNRMSQMIDGTTATRSQNKERRRSISRSCSTILFRYANQKHIARKRKREEKRDKKHITFGKYPRQLKVLKKDINNNDNNNNAFPSFKIAATQYFFASSSSSFSSSVYPFDTSLLVPKHRHKGISFDLHPCIYPVLHTAVPQAQAKLVRSTQDRSSPLQISSSKTRWSDYDWGAVASSIFAFSRSSAASAAPSFS